MQQDTRLSTFWTIYIYLAMTVAGDDIVRSKDLSWNQIIAFVLIVAPTVTQLFMRCLKGSNSH
jgi:hypothetical protein